MSIGFFLYIGGTLLLSGSALIAFCWVIKNGQLNKLHEASQIIFDKDEPIGAITDHFPGH